MSDVDASSPAGSAATQSPSRPGERPRRRPTWVIVVAAVALVALVAVLVRSCTNDDGGSAEAPPSTLGAPTATAIDDAVNKAVAAQSQVVAEVYEKIQPSMVEVDVEKDRTEPTSPGGEEASGLGSGVIVNEDGSILTAFHVVDQANSIEIVFADGTRSKAAVSATDPAHDIAVLRPEQLPSVVVPAVLGGDGVGVGLPIVAVGNPLGLDGTTTSGVISALGRSIRADDGRQLDGLIQFDAAVNPGSSGGPLLNQQGEVVGIVVALADPSKDGYFIGIGFAVPIGTAVATGGDGNEPPK
jgi:S1-C subfamily serine protease